MGDKASKRRAWVKNIAIIFLIIMLILTFFSNTIMNYSLPEVAAQYAKYGSITSSIQASGSVSAVSTYKVYIEETRIIESIAVRTGDTVNKGDLLFTLEKTESGELKTANEELEAAKETLEKLETEYEKYLINKSPEYSDSYTTLKKALDEYNKAVAEASEIDALTSEYKKALSEKEAADEKVSRIQKELGKITETDLEYDNIALKLSQAKNQLATLEIQKNNAEQNMKTAEAALEAYKGSLTQAESYLTSIKEKQSKLESVKERYRSLDDMTAKLEELKKELEALTPETADGDAAGTVSDAYVSKLAEYNSQLLMVNRAKEDLAIDGYYYVDSSSTASLIYELTNMAYTVQNAQNSYDNVSSSQKQAETYYENAKSAYDTVSKEYTEAEAEVKRLTDSQSSSVLNDDLKIAQDILKTAEKTLSEAEEKLNTAESSKKNIDLLKETYESLKKSYEKDSMLEKYTDSDMQKEISKQKDVVTEKEEAVEKLKEKESGSTEVYSKVNGTVASISCYAGETVDRETVLCNLEITDQGYTVDVTVTADQAKRLKTGDAVTVQNNWYTNAEATITSIKTDPSNPSTSRIVTLLVTGNVSAGQSMTFSLGERTTSYQTTVPNSAIYEDNNGKFVLSVEVKASPLGNRYIARRVEVEVVSADETSSAVSGLTGSEFVITSSTKPIADGQQVKLIET